MDGITAPAWLTFAVVAAVFVLPFTISWLVGKQLRMKDVPMRLGLVLFLAAMGLTPFVYRGAVAAANGQPFMAGVRESLKLGIDLAGGTNMVFEVDRDKLGEGAEEKINPDTMDRMVGAIGKRINPSGTEEVTVRRVGQDRIELIVPGADPEKVERMKRSATTLGNLKFLILANETDHLDLIQRGRELPGTERQVKRGDRAAASWKDVGRNKDGTLALEDAFNPAGRTAFRFVDADGQLVERPDPAVLSRPTDGVRVEVLTVLPRKGQEVDGSFLTRARNSRDPQNGRPMVAFNFSTAGSYRFQNLTSLNQPTGDFERKLAVVLDEEVRSAPNILGIISSSGTITGDFTDAEVDEIVDVLNAGALEVPLDPTPVSEFTVSPTLGRDTVKKAIVSILGAGVVVLLFMAFYYRTLGIVADLCLVLNLVLVLGVMSLIEATFTLPGLAGIVLTIGMAVDANVLIFERIREEQARGSSLRMSIQNGFAKAFTTIVDANVTTLITALILFLIGTDQVRGFAVTLFIGILTSMFTALYFGRLICDLLERKRWVKTFKMFSVVGDTAVDFVSKQGVALACSAVAAAARHRADRAAGGGPPGYRLPRRHDGHVPARTAADDPAGEGGPGGRRRLPRERLRRAARPGRGRRGRGRPPVPGADDPPRPAARRRPGGVRRGGERRHAGGPRVRGERTERPHDRRDRRPGRAAGRRARPQAGGPHLLRAGRRGRRPAGTGRRERRPGGAGRPDGRRPGGPVRGAGPRRGDRRRRRGRRLRDRPRDGHGGGVRRAVRRRAGGDDPRPRGEPAVRRGEQLRRGRRRRDAAVRDLRDPGLVWWRSWPTSGFASSGSTSASRRSRPWSTTCCSCWGRSPWRTGWSAASTPGAAVGWLGLEEFKLNLPMIAALLTVIGYSLNDTIVVFDRVREVRGKNPGLTKDILNRSLNQTLSRTILTSLTTLIVVGILYAFGGEGIHGFAYCLVIGILVGTYSTLFIASPVLLWLMNRRTAKPSATAPATAAPARTKVA